MSSAGGCPSWQAMASVRTSIVPPWPCPPLTDTPGTSPVVTTSQVTASIHDFAGSLRVRLEPIPCPGGAPVRAYNLEAAGHREGDPEREQKPLPSRTLERLPAEVPE